MLFKSDSGAHVSTDVRRCQGGGAAIVCCGCMCHPVLWITGKGQELGLGSSNGGEEVLKQQLRVFVW